ncbi:MAG: ABC transporter permease [Verrucomicrobia bacterium]|nr:MAG: ABC transporter permease [Verrucomicrobiota bacterium]
MKHILDIGHNDCRLFLKRKSAYVWLFVVPLLFMYFFGAAMRGPGDPYNRRPRVLIENADTNFLSHALLDELGETLKRVKPEDANDAAAIIRIPADFTTKVLALEQTKVQLLKGKNSDQPADPTIIEFRLIRALIALNGHMLEAVAGTNNVMPLTKSQLRAVIEKPNPVSLDARFAGRKPVPSGFNFSLPSNLVTYLLMNLLIFGGATMAAERRNGVIKRMMIHPITRGDLVLGKIYGLMLLGVVQMVFFLALGKFVFGVNLGANLPAVTFVLLVFAWVAASLGVLAGSVLAAEDRVAGICVLISLLMAALGGCWWPLEMAPPAAKTIALCVPTGWAMQALNQLITFGNGFSAVLVPVAVLLGFGIAANLLAARFFRN